MEWDIWGQGVRGTLQIMRKGTFTHSGTALTDSRLIISKWFNRQWMLLNPLHRRPCKQAGFSVQHQPIIWVACGRAKGFKGIFGRLNHSTGGWRDRLSSLAPVWGGDTVPPSYIMKTFLDTPGIYCGGKKTTLDINLTQAYSWLSLKVKTYSVYSGCLTAFYAWKLFKKGQGEGQPWQTRIISSVLIRENQTYDIQCGMVLKNK